MPSILQTLLSVILLALVSAGCSGVADRLAEGTQRGAERAAEREAARQADRAVTGAVRGIENAVVCLITDRACIERAQRNGQPVVVKNEDGEVVEELPAPGTDVHANYDFTAGQQVLFYEDYHNDRIGQFPNSLEFVRGTWEVVEWQGDRLLRTTGPRNAAFRITLPETLPEQFTIETEVYFPQRNQQLVLMTRPPQTKWSQVDYNYFLITGKSTGVDAPRNSGLSSSLNRDERVHEGLIPIRIMVDGEYAKMFVGENRTSNIPNAFLPRSEALHIENIYKASAEHPMYIGPIRIATN